MSETKHSSGTASRQMSRRSFLKVALQGSAAAGLLSLSSCRAASSSPTDRLITRLNWTKTVEFGGFFAASEKGFYAEEGLDADFLPGGPGIQVEQLVAAGGEAIGIASSSNTFVQTVSLGKPLKAFGTQFQKSPGGLMSLAENPIRTPEDVIGKTIAIPDGARSVFGLMLRKAGIAEDEVNIVPMGFDPTGLATGLWDGCNTYLTNGPLTLQREGLDVVAVSYWDLGVRRYGNVMIALDSTIQEQHDTLLAWLRSSRRGWEYNNQNPEEIAALTVEKISPDLELDLEQQIGVNLAQIPLIESEQGLFWMDLEAWEETIRELYDEGIIDTMVDVEDLVTLDLLNELEQG